MTLKFKQSRKTKLQRPDLLKPETVLLLKPVYDLQL